MLERKSQIWNYSTLSCCKLYAKFTTSKLPCLQGTLIQMNKLLSDINRIAFKMSLINKCGQLIQQRIASCKESIENAQVSANTAQKSSAGDKYETSRAMSHLEKDMYSRQLLANQHELERLSLIDCSILYYSATPGSFILANFRRTDSFASP